MQTIMLQGWEIRLTHLSPSFALTVSRTDGAIVTETEEDILGERGEQVLAYTFSAASGVVGYDAAFAPMHIIMGAVAIELQVVETGDLHLFCSAINGARLAQHSVTNGTPHAPCCDVELEVITESPAMFSLAHAGMMLTGHYSDNDQLYMTVVSDKPRDEVALTMLLSMGKSRAMQHGYMGVVQDKSWFWYQGQSSPLYLKRPTLAVYTLRWVIQWSACSAEQAVADVRSRLFTDAILTQQRYFQVKPSHAAGDGHFMDAQLCAPVTGSASLQGVDVAETEFTVSWQMNAVASSHEEAAKKVAASVLQGGHDACAFYVKADGENSEQLIDLLSYPDDK